MVGGVTYEDPDSWPDQTEGGAPYRFVGQEGEFHKENGSAVRTYLIRATDLALFAGDVLPKITEFEGYPLYNEPWKITGTRLSAERVSWRSHVEGLPVDPFGDAPAGGDNAYHPILEVDVHFAPLRKNEETLLTVQGRASGEFIHTTTPNGDYESPGMDDDASADTITPGSNPVRDPTAPIIITVPITEWTITWHRLPYGILNDTVADELRQKLGKVNDKVMPMLFGAEKETVLFTGYDFDEDHTWRDDGIDPIRLACKFTEKHVEKDGVIHGHNSVWKPGTGWQRVTINADGDPQYQKADLQAIFNYENNAP